MKNLLICISILAVLQACALEDPDMIADLSDFPFRLQIDEEGSDLPDAEDYGAEVSFADYLGDLPSNEIILEYTLEGEGDFANVAIDEIIYEYEDDDCVYNREISFTGNTITIPVDPDLGTVPEEFEVVFAFNLPGEEASDGGFVFEITGIVTTDNVVLNDVMEFGYEILENDLAGSWIYEITTAEQFEAFREAFGPISQELQEISFSDITGEVVFEFEFGEMKIEIELNETELVTECEDGETETEEENLIIEIEADYDAEDGELELEGSYFNEDDEELDFIHEIEYEVISDDEVIISVLKLIDEDNFEDGEELFSGQVDLELIRD